MEDTQQTMGGTTFNQAQKHGPTQTHLLQCALKLTVLPTDVSDSAVLCETQEPTGTDKVHAGNEWKHSLH